MSRSVKNLVLMFAGPALFITVGAIYYFSHRDIIATDNAYIQQHKVSVSAEVSGLIVEIAVHENQQINAGELLFRIDPQPYQLAVEEAKAKLTSVQTHLQELQAEYDSALADIERAHNDIDYFQREYRRQLELQKTNVTTEAALQAAEHALSRARAELEVAKAEAAKTRAALSTGSEAASVHPSVLAAKAQLEQAQLNLARTAVRAPVAGIITQTKRLQLGQMMVQALPAVTIVQNQRSWIEANFKETDLDHMQHGQPVAIEVDSYPNLELKGHVESIGAGTGSEFSLLPAQNANANWVKVTQRIPVRIAIDTPSSRPLIAGMSVNVSIDINQ